MRTKKTTGAVSAEDKALQLFADMMIAKIESVTKDWHKPWFTEGALQPPRNLDGRGYNGMNALMLTLYAEEKGYTLPVYTTFDALQRINATNKVKAEKKGEDASPIMIIKGEKSFPVFVTTYSVINKETHEKITWESYKALSAEVKDNYFVYPRTLVFRVFNIAQTNMQETRPELWEKYESEYRLTKEDGGEMFSFAPVDEMITADRWLCPIRPKYGDDAYFSISKNKIVVPEKSQFKDGESFYSNLFHEMAHSTGHESVLNRFKHASFGSEDYAREELVAELTAALVSQRYGIIKNLKSDSAPYLKCWLDSLKESPNFIKTILNDVRKASSVMTKRIDEIGQELSDRKILAALESSSACELVPA